MDDECTRVRRGIAWFLVPCVLLACRASWGKALGIQLCELPGHVCAFHRSDCNLHTASNPVYRLLVIL